MSEITEAVLDGAMCETCGVYFVKPHGHPVLCTDCFKHAGKDNKTPKARHQEI